MVWGRAKPRVARNFASQITYYNRIHANFHKFPRKRDAKRALETIFRGPLWIVSGRAQALVAR